MPVGPRGEKRPVSSVSSMVQAMRIATGIEEEEYVDGKPRATQAKSSDDEDEPDESENEESEMAALERDKPSKTKKRKNRKKRTPRSSD